MKSIIEIIDKGVYVLYTCNGCFTEDYIDPGELNENEKFFFVDTSKHTYTYLRKDVDYIIKYLLVKIDDEDSIRVFENHPDRTNVEGEMMVGEFEEIFGIDLRGEF